MKKTKEYVLYSPGFDKIYVVEDWYDVIFLVACGDLWLGPL